jgi:hypothetical protein
VTTALAIPIAPSAALEPDPDEAILEVWLTYRCWTSGVKHLALRRRNKPREDDDGNLEWVEVTITPFGDESDAAGDRRARYAIRGTWFGTLDEARAAVMADLPGEVARRKRSIARRQSLLRSLEAGKGQLASALAVHDLEAVHDYSGGWESPC